MKIANKISRIVDNVLCEGTATADKGYKGVDEREYMVEPSGDKFILHTKYFNVYNGFDWVPRPDKVFDNKADAIKAGEDYIDNSY